VTAPAGARPVALVTGASAGIGAALAREFAADGYDLVLVARRADRLRTLADALAAAHGVTAHVLQADLADPAAPEAIFAALEEQGLELTALVNNAGYGVPGELAESGWVRHRDSLQVMVRAPVQLAYLAAPGMAARGRGYILHVASLSALLPPHAGGTLYYPIKSFLLKFALAHGEELRPHGVRVTAVCPGFTHTEFQEAAGGSTEKVEMPGFLWMTAEAVAKQGYRALMRGRPVCIPGLVNQVLYLVFKYMPDGIGRWLVRVTGG
jgi:short-subunit dehydrogenase